MRLCNKYGTAYKTVTDPASIAHLLAAGWHEVTSPTVAEAQPTPEEIPAVTIKQKDPLKYKDRYLSWYVQSGSVKQLREVLRHCGVPFDKGTVKKDLSVLLREYIKQTKAAMKEECGIDG